MKQRIESDMRYPSPVHSKGLCDAYKYKEPTLEDFGLNSEDMEVLLVEYKQYEKKRKNLESVLALFSLLSFPSPLLIAFEIKGQRYNFIKQGSINPSYGYWLFLIISLCYLVFYFVREKVLVEQKYHPTSLRKPLVLKMDAIADFLNAQKEFLWWETRRNEEYWRSMSGYAFECEIAGLFARKGYQARLTSKGADGGIDIVLTKEGKRIAVQCKAHASKISEGIARDLYGVLHAYSFDSGILATINGVSSNTKAFCTSKKDKPIIIMDLKDIIHMHDNDTACF